MSACELCPRTFGTEHALSVHLAKTHGVLSTSIAAVRRRGAPDRQPTPEQVAVAEGYGADWWGRGACSGMGAEVFFPEIQETYGRRGRPPIVAAEKPALAVCAGCDVRADCLQWALEHEDYGVWGGMTAIQRRLLRERAGGRTRNGVERVAAQAARLLRSGATEDEVAAELGLPSAAAVRRLTLKEPA